MVLATYGAAAVLSAGSAPRAGGAVHGIGRLSTVCAVAVQLNHTVVGAVDASASARWLAEMLGLPAPQPAGHFWQVSTANDVGLDFASMPSGATVVPQHYAFLISEHEFDLVHARLLEGGHDTWADPRQQHPGEINHHHGGRGMYFLSNDGHYLEVLTRPYGAVPV